MSEDGETIEGVAIESVIEEGPGGWRWLARRGKRTLGGTCTTQEEAQEALAAAMAALETRPEAVSPPPAPISRQQRRAAQRAARKLPADRA